MLVDRERIGKQWSHRRYPAPKGTNTVARAAVIGYLLIEISANSGRQAKRKMLVERALDMELDATLIVRRGIAQINCHANRARGFGARLQTEKSISPL